MGFGLRARLTLSHEETSKKLLDGLNVTLLTPSDGGCASSNSELDAAAAMMPWQPGRSNPTVPPESQRRYVRPMAEVAGTVRRLAQAQGVLQEERLRGNAALAGGRGTSTPPPLIGRPRRGR